MCFGCFYDGVDRMHVAGRLTGSRIAVIAKTVSAVKPSRVLIRPKKRLIGTCIHGNFGSAQLNGIQSIACRLLNINISSDRRNGDHLNVAPAQCHDDGYGIVGSGVCIDEEMSHGGVRITNIVFRQFCWPYFAV
jgi:hypothetical protein